MKITALIALIVVIGLAASRRWLVFGSFNWSEPSRRFNREIGVISRTSPLFDAFAARWQELAARARPESGANHHIRR